MVPLFPTQVDNAFLGYRTAIWILVLVVLFRLTMGAQVLFNTEFAAQTADGIALDKFGLAGGTAFVMVFKLFGWDFLLLNLVAVVVLIRYRALIPFLYLLFLTEQLGRLVLVLTHPIARTGVHMLPFNMNHVLMGLLAIGFVLSLIRRSKMSALPDHA